ncbi:uncharacterized protein LOC143858146 [Tasmannia lanceolata]|uniref:uncharacterized protein LOC143858146 n=1 Tax=Tasmannia lanceolata TaxID=3420 RepID=UPI004064819B
MKNSKKRAEAERSLAIAEKLLTARDLIGSSKYALQAQDLDPLLDGIDQILTITDVLLAAEKRINNHMDWYAILQLNPSSKNPEFIKRQYRRLSFLLHTDKNKLVGADNAFELVLDAWNVLSDPSKRALYDEQISLDCSTKSTDKEKQKQSTMDRKKKTQKETLVIDVDDYEKGFNFWTTCPYCCNLYEYVRDYENCNLRCQNCKRVFNAMAIQSLPPLVQGMDAYFCTWVFFPLGIPGQNPNLGLGFGPVPCVPNSGGDKNVGFSSWRKSSFPMYSDNSKPEETQNINVSMDIPDLNVESGSVDIESRENLKIPKVKDNVSLSENPKSWLVDNAKKEIKKKISLSRKRGTSPLLPVPAVKKSKVTKKAKEPTERVMESKQLGEVSTRESENLLLNGEIRENIEMQNVVENPSTCEEIDMGISGGNATKDIGSSVVLQETFMHVDGQFHQEPDINDILYSLSDTYLNIKDEGIEFINFI